jgi:hypothetical protein
MSISFMDLFKELDVGDSLLVVGDNVLVFDTRKGVENFEVAVGVFPEGFIASHPHSSEVVSVTRPIVGSLVVSHEEPGQCCPGGDALCWEIVEPQEWRLAHHMEEVSHHVVFVASRGACCDVVRLEPYTWVGATSYFSIVGLKSLGYLIVSRRRENEGKLLTTPGLADGAYAVGMT